MLNGNRRAAVLATTLMLAPTLLAAQARPMGARAPTSTAPSAGTEAARGWANELQQIGTRLQAAHSQVMQDAELKREQDVLMRDFKAAMLRVDPGLDDAAERARTLVGQMNEAGQRRDRATYERLARELAAIQQRVVRAEGTVMQQPAMAQRARAFQELLRRKMMAKEPQFDQLMERSRELQGRLQNASAQGQRPAAPRRTP